MKKRVVSILLAMLMALTALPALTVAPVGAVETSKYAGWKYETNDEDSDHIVLIRYTIKRHSHVVIPSVIKGLPVTEFGNKNKSLLPDDSVTTSVDVSDGITEIPSYAFTGCEHLRKVYSCRDVTRIGKDAFRKCEQLYHVAISDKLTTIEDQAFYFCKSLREIYLPASLTEIGDSAFKGCRSLRIYYGGTREQWNEISIGEENEALTSATISYSHPAHSMEYVPSAETCTESGAAAHYHCSLCGKDYLDEAGETELTDQTAPALGHLGGEWTVTTHPTCTEAGEEKQLCERCGEYCDTRPVAALGHDYQPVSTTAPTCTENGFTTFVCSRCGDTYNSDGQSAPGHYFGDWTVTSAPNCTENGEEVRYCERCGAVETRAIEPLGHSFGDWTVTAAPNCTESGVKLRHCSICGALDTEVIEPNGHSYTPWRVVTWENCTTDGEETRYCTVCGNVDTKVVPATGHSFVDGYCEYCCANDPSAPKIIVSDAWSQTGGDRIELTVSLEDNPGVSSLMLGLSYDENVLILEDVANGELFAEISDFNPFDGGTGSVFFDAASNVTGDGVLMTMTFTINDEVMADWYDVGVFVRAAYDENGDDVAFLWYEGIVDVVVYGDANGDGEITGMDASLILQYAANYDDETGESSLEIPLVCADVNGDGKITGIDASLILQYVANFDDETGTSTVVLGLTP